MICGDLEFKEYSENAAIDYKRKKWCVGGGG